MTKKPRRWLKINGKVNVLGNHMQAHGYSRKKVDILAKQHGVKQSELSLKALSEFFGVEVTEVDQPANSQEILYGSKRGAQRYVPKGKAKGTYAARKEKETEVTPDIVRQFAVMRLSSQPQVWCGYY